MFILSLLAGVIVYRIRANRNVNAYPAILLLSSLFVVSCGGGPVSQGASSSPSPTSSATSAERIKPPEAAEEENAYHEAMYEAKAYWDQFLTKCTVSGPQGGEYTYWKVNDLASSRSPYRLYQGKGEPMITVDGEYHAPKKLSEADRLNGVDPQPIEYEGTVKLSFIAGRCANCLNGGDEWKENFEVQRRITKVKGQWKVWEQSENYYRTEGVDCSK